MPFFIETVHTGKRNASVARTSRTSFGTLGQSGEATAGGLTSTNLAVPSAPSLHWSHNFGLFFILLILKYYLTIRRLCLSTEDCRMTIHHFSELSTDFLWLKPSHFISGRLGATLAPPHITSSRRLQRYWFACMRVSMRTCRQHRW